jgi:hypothetical protein
MAILRLMESRMDAIRQTPTGVSRRASPAGPTAARKKPQTLVEYSRAMTPEEVAAMTPREREDGVVGLKAPTVVSANDQSKPAPHPKGHVDPDHEVGASGS